MVRVTFFAEGRLKLPANRNYLLMDRAAKQSNLI